MPNHIEIEETFCGQTYLHTNVLYVRTDGHLRPALLGRLCRRSDLKSVRERKLRETADTYSS